MINILIIEEWFRKKLKRCINDINYFNTETTKGIYRVVFN